MKIWINKKIRKPSMTNLVNYIFILIYFVRNVDIVTSQQAIGIPCTGPSNCPFKEGCVNNTATGKHICICRLEHMKPDGKTWKENFTACTTDYSPWNISPYEEGVKIESPIYQYERVPDKALRASGTYNGYKTYHARLRENLGKGGWCAPSDTNTQIFQIDLGAKSIVHMIATQGLKNPDVPYMIKTFKIQFADTVQSAFNYYLNASKQAVTLTGNTKSEDIVYNYFDPPIEAKLINIEPVTFENLRCLRVEIYGKKRIDECNSKWNQCDKKAKCNNTMSSFSCKCPAGWNDVDEDGFNCQPVNECNDDRPGWGNNCHKDANCRDTDSSFECVCKPGYQGDGFYCEDIDECEDNKHSCIPHVAICTNTIGAFECACKPGYKGDGRIECADIDECKKGHNCHTDAKCVNRPGSFDCFCFEGYEGNGRSCNDIDECARGSPCHSMAQCVNLIGRFRCKCNDGYRGSGKWCSDIDECAEKSALCKPTEKCYNLAGGYECMCPKHIPLQRRYENKTEMIILDRLLKNVRDHSTQDWQYSIHYHAHIVRDIYSLVKLTYMYHFKEVRNSFYMSFVDNDAFAVELYDFRCTEVVSLNFPNLCHKIYEKTQFVGFTDTVEMFLVDQSSLVFETWATTGAPTPPMPGKTTQTPEPIVTQRPLTTKIIYLNDTNITLTEPPRTTPTPFSECGEYINTPPPDDEDFGIESPTAENFDDRYPSNARCIWTVEAPPLHDVYVEFTEFILEFDPKCSYDSVSVYDNSVNGKLLGKFCGNHTNDPIVPLRSGHGKLVILFQSDSSQEFFGFTFIYKFLNPRAAIICITYNIMSTMTAKYRERWVQDRKYEDKESYVPISRMITCKQYPKCNITRPRNMVFTFEHFRNDRNEKKCIHWPVDVAGSYHSTRPCWIVKTNRTHTVCECHTWGIVAVLGRSRLQNSVGKYVRYDLGKNCFLSVLLVAVCLTFTLVYLFLKDQWAGAMYEVLTKKEFDSGRLIQMHILFQTLLVEIFFSLITFDVEANSAMCYFFAFLFYYLIQTVFFWLLVYTLFLETRIKEIFDSSKYNSYKIYLLIGYGIPFVVTLTVTGLQFEDANQGVCWLLFRGTTVWGFSGVIITLGVVTLALLIHVTYEARKLENGIILQHKCFRAMFTTFFILFTAVFGTLALQERNYFFEWCFSMCNLLQGFSICIMYCILRREDTIIRSNQIGVLIPNKDDDEDDELKQFQDDEDDVSFADMSNDEDDEKDQKNNLGDDLVRRVSFSAINYVPKRERVILDEDEEKAESENQEATVDEPAFVESDGDIDNEMEFMEFETQCTCKENKCTCKL